MRRISVAGSFRQLMRVLPVLAVLISFSVVIRSQSPVDPAKATPDPVESPTNPANPSADPSKSGEALQTRIERARALIAAHRLDTAASELESVRAATQDYSVRNITSVMLMSVYLEEGNYGRAEALLEENFKSRAAQKDESLGTYFALAGQAVNGARTHLARYRNFGINTSDANLPAEAASDLNRLRSLLERMIAQAQEISNGRRTYDSLSLLEDVLGIRLSLAQDSEDQTRWEAEYAGAREALASSQTQIASLGGIPPLRPGPAPTKKISDPSPYSTKRPPDTPTAIKGPEKTEPLSSTVPVASEDVKTQSSAAKPAAADVSEAGSLNAFATRKVVPRYPPMAKQSGTVGLVRVHVIVEGGKVIAVSRSEGPILLRTAAEEAARKWSFQVVSIEGRPTRLSGYIDFNFTL